MRLFQLNVIYDIKVILDPIFVKFWQISQNSWKRGIHWVIKPKSTPTSWCFWFNFLHVTLNFSNRFISSLQFPHETIAHFPVSASRYCPQSCHQCPCLSTDRRGRNEPKAGRRGTKLGQKGGHRAQVMPRIYQKHPHVLCLEVHVHVWSLRNQQGDI